MPILYENKRGTAKLNTNIMSWNVQFIGKPEKVVEALNGHSEKLSGDSKTEYDKALPNLVSLCEQNFGNTEQCLKVVAAGHGWIKDGVPQHSNLTCSIETVYGVVV